MKAIIFDFDGTIADSLEGVMAVFQKALNRSAPFTKKEIETYRQLSLLRIALKVELPWYKILKLAIYGQHSFKLHMDLVGPYAWMAPLLKQLHSEGIRLYIISTNLQGSIHVFLRQHGLSEVIEKVYGRAFVLDKSGKIRTLLHREKLTADEVWYVGDEIVDIRSARRANIPVVSVTWGYSAKAGLQAAGPDAIADSPQQLRKILAARQT